MKIFKHPKSVQEFSRQVKQSKKTVGFVPTMGALHKGHLSLIKQARRETDVVIASIFVNPLQFGPKEDFKSYPRNFKKDRDLLKSYGVDALFYPSVKNMYQGDFSVFVREEKLSRFLCGKYRPGHFQGVVSVVAKLFNITLPDIAYFGQKDYQQALIIKKMVQNLNFPVKIKIMPIVRDKDGLALSSRNAYLSVEEREQAVVLYESLLLAKKMIQRGQRDAYKIKRKIKDKIKSCALAKINYVEISRAENLVPLKKIDTNAVIALAVYIGRARLIDNMLVFINKNKVRFKL